MPESFAPPRQGPAPSEVIRLPIERVRPDPAQARRRFDGASLAELAASIEQIGVAQPILVQSEAGGGYILLAGERRWRAAQRAGLAQIPAVVRDDLDAEQRALFGLIENLQRESLGLMDTAHGLARLADDHALTHRAIAERIGKSRVYVSNFLRLCRLQPTVQELVEAEQISLGHAKILAGLDGADQQRLARAVARRGLSVRQLERAAARSAAGSQNTDASCATKHAHASELAAIERALSEHLGNAVRVRYNPDRQHGELRIAFHGLDEFDGVLARLGFRTD